VLGANLYGYVIPRSADLNLSGGLGGDEIAVGFLYRTDRVRLAAGSQVAALQTGSFTQGAARVQRPALAASFERIAAGAATGEEFTAVVTHLKSKGSSAGGAGDADAGDGQGLSNGSRSRAASEMADWLASSPTGSSDPDVLILGDLNSYLQEDPIRILASRGYRSLFDADSYSYQFNGQWGSLDHMLASDSLYSQVSGSAKWHINSDEPIILDYNIEFKSVAQQTSFYNADPFRTSDHDPLLAGFSLTPTNRPPTAVELANAIASLAENTNTSSRIKLADIAISDDAFGSNSISLQGVDAAAFEVIGTALFLKAGTSLNYEIKTSYAVTVSVGDTTLAGSSPVSTAYSLAVTDVNDAPVFSALTPPVETTGRNSQTEISFAELLAQANATDEDGTVVAFQVAAVASGNLLIGSSAGTATAWAAGSNDRVNAGTNLYWTPAAGQAGTLANPLAIGAFSVYAVDNSGGLSASPVTATVNVVCFLAGTLIASPDGERPIESLKPGDLISTTEGPQPVRFLARSTRSIAQLQALGKMPIRINQGAFGSLGPAQDSFLSPSHAIHFAGSLVEAGALINGTSIQQLDDWPEAALTYYNIELERHGLITANGLLAESYFANYRSNGFSRDCWDNYHDYVALYGAGELMEELPLPRIAFARQIPMQLRLTLQLHEDKFKSAKPGIAELEVDQFAGLCL